MILTTSAPLQASPTTQPDMEVLVSEEDYVKYLDIGIESYITPATQADIFKLENKIADHADKLATQKELAEVKKELKAHDESNGKYLYLAIGGVIAALSGGFAAFVNHRLQSKRDEDNRDADLDRESRQCTAELRRERRTLICKLATTLDIQLTAGQNAAEHQAAIHFNDRLADNVANGKNAPRADFENAKEWLAHNRSNKDKLIRFGTDHTARFNAANAEQAGSLADIPHIFGTNETLGTLIGNFAKAVTPAINFAAAPDDAEKLTAWFKAESSKLNERTANALGKPCNKLIAYLREHINDPAPI